MLTNAFFCVYNEIEMKINGSEPKWRLCSKTEHGGGDGLWLGEDMIVWNVSDLAEVLGVTKRTILKAVNDKKLVAKKIGHHTFVTSRALANFFKDKQP
jgi:excisionase family DNA binding protein